MHFTQATLAMVLAAAGVQALPFANGGGSSGSSTCNGGNAVNWCANKGVWSETTYQDCQAAGGSPYCCESGNGVNVLSCSDIGNIDISLRKRNGGGSSGDSTCNGGDAANYCLNKGKWSEETTQDCYATGGSPMCCSSGDGLNLASCTSIGNGITITLKKRNQPSGTKTCNGGDAVNACENKGVWSEYTTQTCDAEGGSPYCCSSGDGVNVLSCTNVLGDTTIDLGLGSLRERRQRRTNSSGQSGDKTCNGGNAANVCKNEGKWAYGTTQDCTAQGGSPYCCESGDGVNVLSCTGIANGLTIDLGLSELASSLIKM